MKAPSRSSLVLGTVVFIAATLTGCGPDTSGCPITAEQVKEATGASSVRIQREDVYQAPFGDHCLYYVEGGTIAYIAVQWGSGGEAEIASHIEEFIEPMNLPPDFMPMPAEFGSSSLKSATNEFVRYWFTVESDLVFMQTNARSKVDEVVEGDAAELAEILYNSTVFG